MAGSGTGKDISLIIGAAEVESTNQLRADLTKILSNLEINGVHAQIKIGVDPASISKIKSEITSALSGIQRVGTSGTSTGSSSAGGSSGSASYGFSNEGLFKDANFKKIQNAQNLLTQFNQGVLKSLSIIGTEGSAYESLQIRAEALALALKDVGVSGNEIITAEKMKSLEITEESMTNLALASTAFLGQEKLLVAQNKVASLSFDQLTARATRYLEKVKSTASSNPAELNRLTSFVSELKSGSYSGNIQQAQSELLQLQSRFRTLGLESETAGQKIKNVFSGQFSTRIASLGITYLIQQLRTLVDAVGELDKAITNLQIATGYSKDQTRDLIKEYSSLGQEMGATTIEVADAADEWLRQGHSAEESGRLIQDSLMLAKLGQIETSAATTALTSAMKGYGVEVNNVTGIVDKLTAVDMVAATSAGDIATSMSKTATSANIAGVSMDKLIGYITTVSEVTQAGAESVGTFYKTMFARMGNVKAGSLVDPETSEDLSNVENALKGVGIQLRSSGGEFRNFEDVLDEVAGKWKSYSSVTQRAIATAFSGTRGSEYFLTLMENYGNAEAYAETAANSFGTASQKYNDAYLTSIEAAQQSFTASKELFASSVMDSDLVRGFYNVMSDMLNGVAQFNDKVGTGWGVAIATGIGGAITAISKLRPAVNEAYSSILQFVNLLSVGTGDEYRQSISAITIALAGENKATQEAILTEISHKNNIAADIIANNLKEKSIESLRAEIMKSLTTQSLVNAGADKESAERIIATLAIKAEDEALEDLNEEQLKAIVIQSGLKGKNAEMVTSFLAGKLAIDGMNGGVIKLSTILKSSVKSIGKFIAANWEIIAVLAAIGVAIHVYDQFNITTKEAIDAVNESNQALDETLGEISSLTSQIASNQSEIDKLKNSSVGSDKAQVEYLQNQNLKLAEQIRLLELKKEIEEGNKKDAENDAWESMTNSGLGHEVWNGKELSTTEGVLLRIGEFLSAWGSASMGVTFDSGEFKTQSIEEAADALAHMQNRTDEETQTLKQLIVTMSEATGKSAEFASVLVHALDTPAQNAENLSGILNEAFDGKSISDLVAGDISEENKNNSTLTSYLKYLDEYSSIADQIDLSDSLSEDEWQTIVGWIGDKYPDAVNEAVDATSKLADSLEGISGASDGVKKIADAVNELGDEGKVSFSSITDLADAMEDAGVDTDSIENYIKVLSSSESTTQDVKGALNDMLYEYVQAKIGAENLTSANRDLIAAMLKEAGVANSAEVANNLVAHAMAKQDAAAISSASGIKTVVSKLDENAKQCGVTRAGYIKLVAAEVMFNNHDLDVSQKISALRQLGVALGSISGDISDYEAELEVSKRANEIVAEQVGNSKARVTQTQVEQAKEQALNEYYSKYLGGDGEDSLDDLYDDVDWTPRDTGGSGGGSDAADDAHQKYVEQFEDERKQLEHNLKMNYITEEQYYVKLEALYVKYYKGQEEYMEEAMELEEELYEKRAQIAQKWAQAAVDTISSMSSAASDMISIAVEATEGLIEANRNSFDRYKGNLKHQLNMGYITEKQYYQKLEALYKKHFGDRYLYMEEYMENEEEIYQYQQEALEDASSAMEDVHAKVVDMIKQELETTKESIEETKEAYLELIDVRRAALDEQKESEDYEKEHAEKLEAVAELQRQLNALSADNSASGQRKYNEVYSQLQDAQSDLYDFEREHSYDVLNKQLDTAEEAAERSTDSQSEAIEKLLDDNEYLVAEAWNRMDGMSEELYQQLVDYNKKYSTSVRDDITEAWTSAKTALQDYGDAYNSLLAYTSIRERIGVSGMTDEEAAMYEKYAGMKSAAEYTEVGVKAVTSAVETGTTFLSDMAGILNDVFDTPLTNILAIGAGGLSSIAGGAGGALRSIAGMFAGFASGTSNVPRTSIYRTDELGEEIKLLKNNTSGNFSFLTKGSKVIDADATERLMKIANNPEYLLGGAMGMVEGAIKSASGSANIVSNSANNVSVAPVFQITSSDPDGVASEVKKLFPTIADYTLDVIRQNSRSAGRTRSVTFAY